jgi:excisionase family DNA binding protein
MSRQDLLTLHEAAERLGVHYMTVYRYVRTGRLPGRKVGVEWRVDPADLDALAAGSAPRPDEHADVAGPSRPRRRVDHGRRLADRLVAGDEQGSWDVVQNAMASGIDPASLYLDIITPALAAIGEQWSDGTITVGQEHQASVVVHRLIGRLGPQFARRGRKRGTVVVGAPAGDHHSLPSALFADLLRGEGFTVIDLGADTPPSSFVGAATGADRLVSVAITSTTHDNESAVAETITALRAGLDTTIVVGGGATTAPEAERLGADHWGGTARDALALFAGLADDASRSRRRESFREVR